MSCSRFFIKNGFFSEPSPWVPFKNSKLVFPLQSSQISPKEFAARKALESVALFAVSAFDFVATGVFSFFSAFEFVAIFLCTFLAITGRGGITENIRTPHRPKANTFFHTFFIFFPSYSAVISLKICSLFPSIRDLPAAYAFSI